MLALSTHQAQRQEVRGILISANMIGAARSVVCAYNKLGPYDAEYARDWLSTYGRGTWQRKALAAIERA